MSRERKHRRTKQKIVVKGQVYVDSLLDEVWKDYIAIVKRQGFESPERCPSPEFLSKVCKL